MRAVICSEQVSEGRLKKNVKMIKSKHTTHTEFGGSKARQGLSSPEPLLFTIYDVLYDARLDIHLEMLELCLFCCSLSDVDTHHR